MGPGAVTPVAATYAIKRCAPNASASAVSANRARIVAVARTKRKDDDDDDYGDEVGGLVCWRRGRGADASVFVSSVHVDAGHRRRGLGRALMVEAEKFARDAYGVDFVCLSVNTWNAPAISMYCDLGFEIEPRGSVIDVVCDPLRLVQYRMRKRIE